MLDGSGCEGSSDCGCGCCLIDYNLRVNRELNQAMNSFRKFLNINFEPYNVYIEKGNNSVTCRAEITVNLGLLTGVLPITLRFCDNVFIGCRLFIHDSDSHYKFFTYTDSGWKEGT